MHQGSVDILFNTDSNAQIGSAVCIQSIISSSVPDANISDDTLIQCFEVHDSHDPNLKEVYPFNSISSGAGQWLTYNVHFQNTGNDTAYTVVIRDTLSQYLDASTFRFLSSSHKAIIQLWGNAMVFTFPKIDLVDSATNPLLSQGWIQYKVKTKPNLPIGTRLYNTGYIYFDANTAVITNTTTNTVTSYPLAISSSTIANDINLFPNPNKGTLTLSTVGNNGNDYTISDMLGNIITQQPIKTDLQQISLTDASDGVYTLTVRGCTPIRFILVK